MDYDLAIRGGTLVDGSGRPGVRGDLGIRNGRFAAVGEAPGAAASELDATGRIVAPGFIDLHTHYDAQVLWDRMLSISPWQGVTKVVVGNCGFGVAPTRPEHRGLVLRTLEKGHAGGPPAAECAGREDPIRNGTADCRLAGWTRVGLCGAPSGCHTALPAADGPVPRQLNPWHRGSLFAFRVAGRRLGRVLRRQPSEEGVAQGRGSVDAV